MPKGPSNDVGAEAGVERERRGRKAEPGQILNWKYIQNPRLTGKGLQAHLTWQQELEGKVVLSSCQDPCGNKNEVYMGEDLGMCDL